MIILDEAFAQATLGLYGEIEIFPFEALAILETALDDLLVLKPADSYSLEKATTSRGAGVLFINILDVSTFVSQLLKIGRDLNVFLEDSNPIISDWNASLAIQRVIRIVQDTWPKSAEAIIKHSVFLNKNMREEGKRPSEYSRKEIQDVISSIGLNFDNFSHCRTGHDLICVPRPEVRKVFGLSSSLLLLRFQTVQRVMQLLELWSDKGVAYGLPHMPFSRDRQAWGLLLPTSEQPVEAAVFPQLLSCYTTFGRTHSCGWTVELLTSVCARIAGAKGTLLSREAFDPQELAQTPLETGINLIPDTWSVGSDSGNSGIDDGNPMGYTTGWLDLDGDLNLEEGDLQEWYKAGLLLVQRESGQGQGLELPEDKERARILFFAPLGGLRCLRDDYVGDKSRMLTASKAVDAASIGMHCCVDGLESLRTACERFVWWDRPSEATLNAMAGGVVEIVGATEVLTKHRVGVRLLPCLGGEHVIDALPIECLTVKIPGDSNSGEISVLSSTLKRKTGKKAAKRAQRTKTKPRMRPKKAEPRPSDDTESTDNSSIATESGVFSSKREEVGEDKELSAVKDAGKRRVIPAPTAPAPGKGQGLNLASPRGEDPNKPVDATKPPRIKSKGARRPSRPADSAISSQEDESASSAPDPPKSPPATQREQVRDKPGTALHLTQESVPQTAIKGEARECARSPLSPVIGMRVRPLTASDSSPKIKGREVAAIREDKAKAGTERPKKVRMPPFGWLKARAVAEYGQRFSLQTAMKKLEDRINAPADPAYLHPAYQAMLRLEQIPSVSTKRVSFDVNEEVVKSFAIYRLLGRSSIPSDSVDRRDKSVVYVPEVAQELEQRKQDRVEQAAREEEEFLLREVGRVRKVLDDSYIPYGPLDGENDEGKQTRLEPYLALLRQKKGVVVVTETKERINMPPERRYEEEGEDRQDDHGAGDKPDMEANDDQPPGLEVVLEHGAPLAISPSVISIPQSLLSVTAKPLLPNSTTKSAQLSAQAKTAEQEASWVSERNKGMPYWKRDKWESVATDAGVGTDEFSRRITAHARPPKEKFENDTRRVFQPPPEPGKAVAPSALILAESIALEEARRQQATKDGDNCTRLINLRDAHGKGIGTQHAGVPNEDFVDFVQGNSLRSLKEVPAKSAYFYREEIEGKFLDEERESRDFLVAKKEYKRLSATFVDNLRTSVDDEARYDGAGLRPPELRLDLETLQDAGFDSHALLSRIKSDKPPRADPIGFSAMSDSISAIETERGKAADDSPSRDLPDAKVPSAEEQKFRSRPVTAPEGTTRRYLDSPRVNHLEDLGFLSAAVDMDTAIDYYNDVGEAQLRKTLALRARRPWTQENAAPDPSTIDKAEQEQVEKKERELRKHKHKAKFILRSEAPDPKVRPISGLPSSPTSERRKEIRIGVALSRGEVEAPLAANMLNSLSQTPLVPLSRPRADQSTRHVHKSVDDASLDHCMQPSGTAKSSKENNDTRSVGAIQATSRTSLHTSVPSLPRLVPFAHSLDAHDEAEVSNTEAVSKVIPQGDNSERDAMDLSRDEGDASTARSSTRADSHPLYKLDPESASRRGREKASSPLSAIIVARDTRPGGALLAQQAGHSLASLGGGEIEVTISKPLYIQKEREAIERDKRFVQDSGFDLGALIDNLLMRREQRVVDAENGLVATPANDGARVGAHEI